MPRCIEACFYYRADAIGGWVGVLPHFSCVRRVGLAEPSPGHR